MGRSQNALSVLEWLTSGGVISLEDTPQLTAGFITDADSGIFLYNVRERVSSRCMAGVIL